MKFGIFTSIVLLSAGLLQAQEMSVHKTNGTIYKIKLADIEKITFEDEVTNDSLLTDVEGNKYKTVKIGTQVWMAENLKTTKYANGEQIARELYSFADANPLLKNEYGLFYIWSTTQDSRNVCPTGWHVPTDPEWTVLDNFLGGESVSGSKLREKGLTHWDAPNLNATDEVGFRSLPIGQLEGDGSHSFFGFRAYYWTSTVFDQYYAWFRWHDSNYVQNNRQYYDRRGGAAIRCVKNQ